MTTATAYPLPPIDHMEHSRPTVRPSCEFHDRTEFRNNKQALVDWRRKHDALSIEDWCRFDPMKARVRTI